MDHFWFYAHRDGRGGAAIAVLIVIASSLTRLDELVQPTGVPRK